MKEKVTFFIFGGLQAIFLGLIIFFLLEITSIGKDTVILLSVLFPVFTFIVEYIIYSKK
jgi:hypothetical protein